MDIQQRRSLVDSCINDETKFRRCCQKNYLSATVQDRDTFNSEEFYVSVGSREIVAIFKAGEKNTPQDRAFDMYLPRSIESGTYPLNSPDQLIQIALTENFPAYTSYWAFKGVMYLSVSADKQKYSGTFDIHFKDKQNFEFASQGTFSFSTKH
ncbi:hypothetical protein PS862_03810 [Pseudomonas fluorescens]|uniref:Uncharacterized protein n=1 Tax=Pseudomonas fluorescens TaxID=294 RepID=A0A5E7M0Q3_PSEFL|nr:hypothetical protein [Pseudomonas fluorescens]VVP20140.1 hypothetical protein PS862_03810 [Pseudomonas fluorescens]